MPPDNRLFVQVACYRDREIQPTIEDLFAKAAHPELITIGLCLQLKAGEDDDLFVTPHRWRDQIRIITIPVEQSKGSGWARSIAQSLIQDELYTLQIDSHTRFSSGWDDILRSALHSCNSDYPVISFNPSTYTPDEWQWLAPNELTINAPHHFNENGLLVFFGGIALKQYYEEYPARGAIVGFPLMFSYSRCFEEVKIDPYMRFYVGEVTHSVRLFTHGWDVFAIAGNTLFHNYYDSVSRIKGYATNAPELLELSFDRARYLLGIRDQVQAGALERFDEFGLGKVRTLQDYQQFSGIDFKGQSFTKDKYIFELPPHLRRR